MDEFKRLCRELERHREQMFFTIGRTIQDAANMFDVELYRSLQAICSIYDEKYTTPRKKEIEITDYDFWEWIEKQYLRNYEDSNFSFSWLKSYDQLKSCLSPLFEDDAYKDFLELTEYTGGQYLNFCEQLFFLSGSFRFYKQFGNSESQNIDIYIDIQTILRIDREVAFIRESVYSALATRNKKAERAKGTTGAHVTNELKKLEPFIGKTEKYHAAFVETQKELKKANVKISFNKFVEYAAPKTRLSKTGLFDHFKAIGINKENFKEWLTKL